MLNPAAPLKLKDPSLFRQENLIGGTWVGADSGRTVDVRNPANGELVGTVPARSRCAACST
jgi:succinate-semialdehyde dehydrogenase/glutarate-semialdehyde dehydrogenase